MGASTIEHVRTGVACNGAIVLTMLFFWGGTWTLNPDSDDSKA